jgi:hypothetical protein
VRDLRDAKNPYKGQYAPYDLWIFTYAWQQAQAKQQPAADGRGSGYWYAMAVDEEGWPVPLKREQELLYGPQAKEQHCRRSISAWGYMGETLENQQQRDLLASRASFMPPISAWLGEHGAASAMLLPGGEVVTRGEAGSNVDLAPQLQAELPYCRYSATGELLGQVPGGGQWWELYWPDFAKLRDSAPDSSWTESMGYVFRYDRQADQRAETYDYQGRRVRGTPPYNKPGYFEWLSGDTLRELYRLQQGQTPLSESAISL